MISVCMPAYNAEKYIKASIQSVLAQTNKNWELIIVDDGSEDNTYSIAQQFASINISVLSVPNKGAAAARNIAYSMAKGNFIKFMDADDLLNSEMLENQYNLAIAHPQSVISAQWGRFYKDDLNTFKLNVEECWQTLNSVEWLQSAWKNAQPMTQPGIFLIPREIIESVGTWDETLSLNDDMEFFTRVILQADKVVFSNASTLYYRSGLGSGALSATKSEEGVLSNYASISSSIEYMLSRDKSEYTRLLCANLLQLFVYDSYLLHPKLVKKAEKKIAEFGGSNLQMPSGKILQLLSRFFGWKFAKKIHNKLQKKDEKSVN